MAGRPPEPLRLAGAALGALLVLGVVGVARGDGCLLDAWTNGVVPSRFLFPNWSRVWVASYSLEVCDGCGLTTELLAGITIVNFGTAGNADLAKVYAQASCNTANSGLMTFTFAGSYPEDSGLHEAWTWAGGPTDFAGCADACAPCTTGVSCCGAVITLEVYADVAACPANLATVSLGMPFHGLTNTTDGGSISDDNGCVVPLDDLQDEMHTIVYTLKTGPDSAAPGDTLTYTVQYGMPGLSPLTGIEIVDTLPPYTHYVTGSAVPAPVPGWDPDPGPPMRLRWLLPGGPVAGGGTGELRFNVTVDWGNGEAFEPGSGDVGAPEGSRLDNRAHVLFGGTTCLPASQVNPPVTTVVRRFLFWTVGDNDVLFSASLGQPADEIIYETFVKNLSPVKTWWNVELWDTVPPLLDAWCPNCGLEDPCVGWTMTPTGCAAASPGSVSGGGGTILTWHLDLPPGETLTVRWKSQIVASAVPGATVVNVMSLQEFGQQGRLNGTGNSGTPRQFTHLAPVILPTMYTSYVGMAGSTGFGLCPGFTIDFFPLNKKTQFELRGVEHQGPGWAATGGVSESIGCLIGDCLGGFPGNLGCTVGLGAIRGGGIAGCRVERTPAQYNPTGWAGVCPTSPLNNIYKVTSNSPVLWQFLSLASPGGDNEDRMTYAPATTLSYAGLMHYAWRLTSANQAAGNGDSLSLINTGRDAYGALDRTRGTTVHLFSYDYATLSWDYRRTYDLAGESQAFDEGTLIPDVGPWRTISSDNQLLVAQGFQIATGLLCCCSGCGNDYAALMPVAENGHVVSPVGAGSFYGIVQGMAKTNGDDTVRVVVGNTGPTDATYGIWRYAPLNAAVLPPMPPTLNGTAGSWTKVAQHTVPAGLAAAGNPRIYNQYSNAFDGYTTTGLYKVELESGGPLQILSGMSVYSYFGDGSILHAADGNVTGIQYWFHNTTVNLKATCPTTQTISLQVYCPKTGMAVRAVSEDGYDSTYTTTGPDQSIAFLAISSPAYGAKRNFRLDVQPGPASGNVIAQYLQCTWAEKGYTAPFMQTDVHYLIIAPPVAYVGQSFWITVVVMDASGQTKASYCGTSSFTSTDSAARIEGQAMDAYNYAWTSNAAGSTCNTGSDNGVKLFFSVTFTRLGFQTIIASDTTDGSITGLAAVLVVGADVKLTKLPPLQVSASGDTVQFRICWSNYSSASASTFTITDDVPDGTVYVPDVLSNHLCGATKGFGASTVAYSTDGGIGFMSMPVGGPATTGVTTLRWTIPTVGVATTGCVCFRVTVR